MSAVESYELPGGQCPGCNAKIDGATSMGGSDPPRPGSVTICAYCGKLLRLNDAMQFEALAELPTSFSSQERRAIVLLRAKILTLAWLRRRGINVKPS